MFVGFLILISCDVLKEEPLDYTYDLTIQTQEPTYTPLPTYTP